MKNSRRGFLFGATAALLAAPAIARASSLMPCSVPPVFWGDGIHDDSAALQWEIDRAERAGQPMVIADRVMRIDKTLRVKADDAIVHNNFILTTLTTEPLLRFCGVAQSIRITDNRFRTPFAPAGLRLLTPEVVDDRTILLSWREP